LKTCFYPWFKDFAEHLADNKVVGCTWHRGGHQGVVLYTHYHKHLETRGSVNFFVKTVEQDQNSDGVP
jgi:hypothetical protein